MPMIPPVASTRMETRSTLVRRRPRAGIIDFGCGPPDAGVGRSLGSLGPGEGASIVLGGFPICAGPNHRIVQGRRLPSGSQPIGVDD